MATSHAIATRRNVGAKIIRMDLDKGQTCSDDPQYGLTVGLTC